MRKMLLSMSVGLAAMMSVAPAQAQDGVAYFRSSTGPQVTLPNNLTTVVNLNTGVVASGATAQFAGNTPGAFGITSAAALNQPTTAAAVRKPTNITGNYAYVSNSATYTLTFNPAQYFTFLFGSLNNGNSVTLSFAGGGSKSYTGAALATAATASGQAGRFVYDAQGIGGAAGSVIKAVFTSGTQGAFEFGNIATAAPEPAAWVMMILGFGLVGGALRRGRPARKAAFA